MNDLDGRVIAIAGASGGLGPSVAAACRRRRDDRRGRPLAGAPRRPPRRARSSRRRFDARVVDLLDEQAARQWAVDLRERFGGVDALLHLVGGWRGGQPLAEAPLADYEWLHDLLVRTVQHTTRAFHDALAASDHGRFVLVSSSQAQSPEGTNAAYAAAKAAAESWTLALADSFKDTAATANIIVVNAILTPRMREENPDKPFRTFTSAEQIAEAIAFVCSDAAAKMNGQRLSLHP